MTPAVRSEHRPQYRSDTGSACRYRPVAAPSLPMSAQRRSQCLFAPSQFLPPQQRATKTRTTPPSQRPSTPHSANRIDPAAPAANPAPLRGPARHAPPCAPHGPATPPPRPDLCPQSPACRATPQSADPAGFHPAAPRLPRASAIQTGETRHKAPKPAQRPPASAQTTQPQPKPFPATRMPKTQRSRESQTKAARNCAPAARPASRPASIEAAKPAAPAQP